MIKIDKGVPMPETRGKPNTYPIRELEVGDSFFAPGKIRTGMTGTMRLIRLETGRTFTTRSVTEDGIAGIRVWRLS